CPWSRLQATSEKSIGALFCSSCSRYRSVNESLPPETPTRMRSPSSIILKSPIARPASRSSRLSRFIGARLKHKNVPAPPRRRPERSRRAVRRLLVHRVRHLPRAGAGRVRQHGERAVVRGEAAARRRGMAAGAAGGGELSDRVDRGGALLEGGGPIAA